MTDLADAPPPVADRPSAAALTATAGPDGLTVAWADRRWTFHPLWLREQSRRPDARDPATGQRLFDAWRLPADLGIDRVAVAGDTVTVTFTDGHQADFQGAWLRQEIDAPVPDDLIGPPRLWDQDTARVCRFAWDELMASDRVLLAFADALGTEGFAVLDGAPLDPDAAERAAGRFGPIRRTNWGGVADVRAEARAVDLTMTNRALEPHADNPYRLPAPGYILLHCLRNDAEGGESTLVDGFQVAGRIRREDPAAFETLTTTATRFRYADPDTVLENGGPLIELGPDGRVRRLRFSNRTEETPALPAEALARYYAARRLYAGMLHAPENTLEFKLDAGQLLMIDNYRLLHGRRGYTLDRGGRHLRQAYLDRDAVASRQKVLRRRFLDSPEPEARP